MFSFLRRARGMAMAEPSEAAFPTQQLFILALCRICEPIAFMSIFPYVYFMISSFNITTDDRQISIYVGMVTSAFAFAEFSSGVLWGRLSDKVGRKPILLTGLAGTGLSMIVFGFAPNLQVALLARALGGLLNGNISVLQTTVAEVVKVKEHQPRAYSIMPFVWGLGSIIGSGLGGCLAEPVKNYPGLFVPGSIFETFPFLLPNLVCASVVLSSLVIGILFLDETHEKKKDRRDYGRELGSWLIGKLTGRADCTFYSKLADANMAESDPFIDDEPPPQYSSKETTPRLTPTRRSSFAGSEISVGQVELDSEKPELSVRSAFSKQVILHIIAYGILAFHTISFEQLVPVLLSSKEASEPPTLPFKFVGGYELLSSKIGFILSLQGVYQMFAQMIVFPIVVRKIGALRTFKLAACAWAVLYFTVPYLVLLPKALRMPGLAAVLISKVTLQTLAYPSNALLLANSAPSLLVLGAINGVAASAASLSRAIGPTFSGIMESLGSSAGYSGLAWWVIGAVSAIGALEVLLMTEPSGRSDLAVRTAVDEAESAEDRHDRHSSETEFSDMTLVEKEGAVHSKFDDQL